MSQANIDAFSKINYSEEPFILIAFKQNTNSLQNSQIDIIDLNIILINSSKKVISNINITDNVFLTHCENILIQNAPQDTTIKYCIITFVNDETIKKKFDEMFTNITNYTNVVITNNDVVNESLYIGSTKINKKLISNYNDYWDILFVKESSSKETSYDKNDTLIKFSNIEKNNDINHIITPIDKIRSKLNSEQQLLLSFSILLANLNKEVTQQNYYYYSEFKQSVLMNLDINTLTSLNIINHQDSINLMIKKNYNFSGNSNANAITTIDKRSENFKTKEKTSVFEVLNNTCTSIGTRYLKQIMSQPLQTIEEINYRLNCVEMLSEEWSLSSQVKHYLYSISDIGRLLTKLNMFNHTLNESFISYNECLQLKESLLCLREAIATMKIHITKEEKYQIILDKHFISPFDALLNKCDNLISLLKKSLIYDKELMEVKLNYNMDEELRSTQIKLEENWKVLKQAKKLAYLEITGKNDIEEDDENDFNNDYNENDNDSQSFSYSNNKTKKNKQSSSENKSNKKSTNKKNKNNTVKINIEEYREEYVLSIPKAYADNLLQSSKFKNVNINKANKTFTNNEMKEASKKITILKNHYKKISKSFWNRILKVIYSYSGILEQLVYFIGELDCFISFAGIVKTSKNIYSKPTVVDDRRLEIINGRHILLDQNNALIRKLNKNENSDNNIYDYDIIPNDCYMSQENTVMLLTGVNMAGKTTYLRQVGLIVYLAHIGMFIPCDEGSVIPLTDRIITRVGADDNLLKGMSTFYNEMTEVASMCEVATNKSLLLIDEIGRGTSTKDGFALSAGILEYIAKDLNSFCVFATHFHELTKLNIKSVKNFRVDYSICKDKGLILKYKILEGENKVSLGVELLKFMDLGCLIELIEDEKNTNNNKDPRNNKMDIDS